MRRLEQGQVIRGRYEEVSAQPVPLGSDLWKDDEATSWMALSHVVSMALSMATDNMRAVDGMLLSDGQLMVPLYAHYPVLRSVLESAAEAKWILSPDDRKERVHRLLRARVEDIRQDSDLAKLERETLMALEEPPTPAHIDELRRATDARYAKHLAKAQELAESNGIAWASIKNGLPPWAHIIKAVCSVPALSGRSGVPGGYAAGLWKIMSGLSHPSPSRSARHSVLDPISEAQAGVIHAQTTASLRYTLEATTVAFNTAHEAVELYESRLTPLFA
jgi:hypothetical protein